VHFSFVTCDSFLLLQNALSTASHAARRDLEYITMLDLRSPVAPEKWTLRGVALLCDTK